MSSTVDPVITGIGQSAVARFVDRAPILMTIDAVREALADAGLTRGDIDGVATWPGKMPTMLDFAPVGCDDLIEAMRLKVRWYGGAYEKGAQFGAIADAVAAIRMGWARHVICFRTIAQGSGRRKPEDFPSLQPERLSSPMEFLLPFGAYSAANWIAQYAARHFHRYGTTREQLGQIAINGRRNAAENPKAIFRDPITMDDYLAARMISTPLCIYDCDTLTDASTVIIVSAPDAARDARKPGIRIDAIAGSLRERYSWDQAEEGACYATGQDLWTRTDYSRDDVRLAQLYDGFSFLTLQWIEALGFCSKGEGGAFLEGGQRIARTGELPLNTNGGQIGAGRTHAFGYIHEAVLQLRGEAGARQVAGKPRLAVCGAGGGPLAMAMLLARD